MDPAEARATALQEVDEHASGTMRRWIQEVAATPGTISVSAVTEQDLAAMTEGQRDLILETRGWISVKVHMATDWFPDCEWVARTLAGQGLRVWRRKAVVCAADRYRVPRHRG
jgi:hypothetical protein